MAKKKPDIRIVSIKAKSISYGGTRDYENIRYVVIHYTGNVHDNARNNGLFFQNGNKRAAGAHFFVDKQGIIVKSININRIAYSVGGFFTKEHDAALYHNRCTNANSVSIELCDLTGNPSAKQTAAVAQLIDYIQYYCPNATTIIRHWDVNGKDCPAPMAGKGNERWKTFKKKIA